MISDAGKVYLAGAGPGDPNLLTLRAAEVLQLADVVIYDYLVNPALLKLTSESCEKIYAGKQKGCHELTQDQIGQLLIERARAGKRVVRLKGGDPYIFGRGGEEGLMLAAAGIAFESIPGISSATTAPAYAGIPLLDAEHPAPAVIITGHHFKEDAPGQFAWDALAAIGGTIVALMGVSNLAEICGRLIDQGVDAETPASIIEWASYPRQRSLSARLKSIAAEAESNGFHAPAVIVIGQTAARHEGLNWFETRPLFGRRILLTQAAGTSAELRNEIIRLGGEAIDCPMIRIEPVEDASEFDSAFKHVAKFDWLVFTSANAVEAFFKSANSRGLDSRFVGRAKITAVGQATSQTLLQFGLRADLIPQKSSAQGLVEAFTGEKNIARQKILFPCGDQARPNLEDGLKKLGAQITRLVVYRTLANTPENFSDIEARLMQNAVDAILFGSPSAVRNFFDALAGPAALDPEKIKIIAIGPTTAQSLIEQHNINPRIAPSASAAGLLEVLLKKQ